MYFSMFLSFERSWARQRCAWMLSSKAGGRWPCAGLLGAAVELALSSRVTEEEGKGAYVQR